MSEFAGELSVKIVPDTSKFAAELQTGMAGQSKMASAVLQKSGLEAQLANLGPLIKSQGLVGSQAGIESTRKNLVALEQTAKTYPQLAAAAAAARAQFDLLTRAEIKTAAATEAVAVANRQASRNIPLASGFRSQLLNVGRAAEGGASLGQLASFGVKAGAVGLAVSGLYQALQKAQQALRVTGDQAGTTEGRFRNFGAALLSGDVIGGLSALTKGAELSTKALSDLQSQVDQADFSQLTKLQAGAKALGAKELQDQLKAVQLQSNLNFQQAAFRNTATGAVARSGLRPDDRGGIQGVGAAGQIDTSALLGVKQARRAENLANAALRASLTEGLKDDLRVAKEQEKAARARVDAAAKGSDEEKKSLADLVSAHNQTKSIGDQIISAQQKRNDDRKQQLQKEIALAQTGLQIELAQARTSGQQISALQDQAAFSRKTAATKGLDAQQQAQFSLEAAQADKQIFDIQQQQAEQAKQAAADAARAKQQEIDAEKERYRTGLSLTEQRLQLRVQAAQLTDKNLKDDKKAIKAEIAFYKAEARDRKLSVQERLTARSNEISARLSLKGLSTGNNTAPASTPGQLFSAAAQQFKSFGSNIAGRNGILSGQDARAAYASRVLGGNSAQSFAAAVERARANSAAAHLSEAQRQTALLKRIADGVAHYGTPGPIADSARRARNKARVTGGQ